MCVEQLASSTCLSARQLSVCVKSSIIERGDPTPGADGHYLPFDEAFGKQSSEAHRPSLKTKAT